MLWRDRGRYLSAVLAVAFSAVLIAIQCGLMFGILACSSVPIDNANADIWITTRDTTAIGQAHPIPEAWLLRAAAQPEVVRAEGCLVGFGIWHKQGKSNTELCIIIGSPLDEGSLGALRQLPAGIRRLLIEPDTVVVDKWDLFNLGMQRGPGEVAEINGQQVRVVGTMHSFQGLNFAWIHCSLETARMLVPVLGQREDLTMFGLARCRRPEDVPVVVRRLRARFPEMGVYAAAEFSRRVQVYWLLRSKGGTVMVCTVVLALLVGLVITSQTLYGAVLASLREYAVLDSLGIPRWRLVGLVLATSLWIGLAGVILALPVIYALSWAALLIRTWVLLWGWLLIGTAGLTVIMALASGLLALRSLRHLEPATLLR